MSGSPTEPANSNTDDKMAEELSGASPSNDPPPLNDTPPDHAQWDEGDATPDRDMPPPIEFTPDASDDLQFTADVNIEEHERRLKDEPPIDSSIQSKRRSGINGDKPATPLPSISVRDADTAGLLTARGTGRSLENVPEVVSERKSAEKLPEVKVTPPIDKPKKVKSKGGSTVSPPEPYSSQLNLPHGRIPASKQQSTLFKDVKAYKVSPRPLDQHSTKLPALSGKAEQSSPSPRGHWRNMNKEEPSDPDTPTMRYVTRTIPSDRLSRKTKVLVRQTKPKLSKSEANFVRLSKMVAKVGSDLLRLAFTNYLDRQYPPRRLHQFLANNKRRLKSYATGHRLLYKRWDVMYPNDDETKASLQRLDAAVVFWFLRFICHLKRPNDFIWKRKPGTDDLTETADIARIRDYRNFLINISLPALYDDEYDRKVDELKKIAMRIGMEKQGDELCRIIEDMRVEAVRYPERDEYLTILNQWADETNDRIIGEYDLAPAKAGGGTIRERKEMTRKFLENHRSPRVFVRTKTYQKAKSKLLSEGSVVLKGNTGDGKTTMAIALMVSEFDEDECSLITSPDQWNLVDHKNVSAILIDDIFGSGSLDEGLLSAWEDKFEEIWECAAETRERVGIKVIITIRQHIFDQCFSRLSDYALFAENRIVDIASSELVFQEKRAILGRHLMSVNKTLAKSEIDKSAKIHNSRLGFPQCCALYVSKDTLFVTGAQFFERPIEFLFLTLEKMFEGEKFCYLALALMMFQRDGILYVRKLMDAEKGSPFLEKLMDLAFLCSISPTDALPTSLLESLPLMNGSFVTYYEDKDCYTFSHESIMEAMMASFGEKHPQEVLEGCSLPFLMDFVGTDLSFEDRGEIFIMRAKQQQFGVLAKVLEHYIVNGEVKRVSQHRAMKDLRFLDFFFDFLEDKNTVVDVILSEDNNFRETQDSPRKVGFLFGAIDQEIPNIELVNHILRRGAFNSNKKEKWCEQEIGASLEMAIKKGNYEIYTLLVEAGAEIPDKVLYVEQFLVSAEIIRDVLVRRQWSQEQKDIALVRASRGTRPQSLDILNLLLKHSAAINSVRVGTTALCEAAKTGKMKTVNLLLVCGASPEDRDATQQTPLHHACDWNNIEVVKLLLKKNADVNARDALGFTPYLVSAGWGRDDIMELLLSKKIDCLASDDQENTVLHICAANGQAKIMKMVLDRFPQEMKTILIQRNRHGWTPLDFALRCGHLGVTKLLILTILKDNVLKTNGRTFVHTRFYVVKLEDFNTTERYQYRFLDGEAGRTCFQMPRGNWFIQAGTREEYEQVRQFSIKFENKLRQCLAKS